MQSATLSDPKSLRKIRVIVADNSSIHTQLLAESLRREPAFEVTPFDSDSRDLISSLAQADADVLVISSSLDGHPMRGLQILRDVRAANLKVRIVVLMDSLSDEDILNAFRSGARGLFGKSQPVELLSKCVRSVHDGEIWAENRQIAIALDALCSGPIVRSPNPEAMGLLSQRELQVVQCLAEGLTNREIAKRLKLSPHTVKNHLFRVFDKLGVSNRIELLFMTLSPVDAQRVSGKSSSNEPDPSPLK